MNTRIRSLSIPGLLALSLSILPGTGGAAVVRPGAEDPVTDVREILDAAEALAGTGRSSWGEANALYLRAAELAEVGSVEAIEGLRGAGMMTYYLGDLRGALALTERAAEAAAASGQILLAAHAYLDGAWIAMELDRSASVRELGERASLLARSPYLTDVDRTSILLRVQGAEVRLLSER